MFKHKKSLNRLYNKRNIYKDIIRTCIMLGSIKEKTRYEIKLMTLNNKIDRVSDKLAMSKSLEGYRTAK